jgi:hypothetical protein
MDQQLSALSQDEERKPASKRRYVPGHDRERDTFKPLRAERRRDDDDYEYDDDYLDDDEMDDEDDYLDEEDDYEDDDDDYEDDDR